MSYGVLIKNSQGVTLGDSISFSGAERGGICTSDPMYLYAVNFTANQASISFSKTGSIVGTSLSSMFSEINFDFNNKNFYGIGANMSKPTIVEICQIEGYEYGYGKTVFSSNFSDGCKYIKNYSDPNSIYIKNSNWPISVQTSYFSNSISFSWPSSSIQNFIYAKFKDTNVLKYFLAIPDAVQSSNISWCELPCDNFFYDVNFYATINYSTFQGTTIPLSIFNGIVPSTGDIILINNANFNDLYSGAYEITSITNNINIKPWSEIVFNFPGQVFNAKVDLDFSNSLSVTEACHYVPYAFGYPSEPFLKSLYLVKYSANDSYTNFPPLWRDDYSNSSLIIGLNKVVPKIKNSDTFMLGVAVSNWCPDSRLFGVGFEYEIKEGY